MTNPIRSSARSLGPAIATASCRLGSGTIPTRGPRRAAILSTALLIAGTTCLIGCSTASRLSGDHAADMRNERLRWDGRADAFDRLWEETLTPTDAHHRTRELAKEMLWNTGGTPTELRLRIMERMLNDADEASAADSRRMARLMIPKEPSRAMIVYLASVSSARGWTDFTGPFIRSFSRPQMQVPDRERAEHTALARLHPSRPVERTVYEAFVNPPEMDPVEGIDVTQRLRTEAWDLLARLDPSGSFRLDAVRQTAARSDDAVLAAIQRSARDLGAIPIAGSEIPWLLSLQSPENAPWWSESTAAVARLSEDQRRGLALRHVEAIRWCAANAPDRLAASRESLLAELEARLEDRTFHRRARDQEANRRPQRQDLEFHRERLTFADLVTVLTIDDAIRAPAFGATVFQQRDIDHADKSTEYGGLVEFAEPDAASWSGSVAGPRWFARFFPPRSSQRFGDDRFVASDDMMNAADRALAIYHFHTQRLRNEDYAGPSDGDLEFAARIGRSCLVLTSIRDRTVNVDYYQPDGVVLDLGDIER
jgi:hypothetical protein